MKLLILVIFVIVAHEVASQSVSTQCNNIANELARQAAQGLPGGLFQVDPTTIPNYSAYVQGEINQLMNQGLLSGTGWVLLRTRVVYSRAVATEFYIIDMDIINSAGQTARVIFEVNDDNGAVSFTQRCLMLQKNPNPNPYHPKKHHPKKYDDYH